MKTLAHQIITLSFFSLFMLVFLQCNPSSNAKENTLQSQSSNVHQSKRIGVVNQQGNYDFLIDQLEISEVIQGYVNQLIAETDRYAQSVFVYTEGDYFLKTYSNNYTVNTLLTAVTDSIRGLTYLYIDQIGCVSSDCISTHGCLPKREELTCTSCTLNHKSCMLVTYKDDFTDLLAQKGP